MVAALSEGEYLNENTMAHLIFLATVIAPLVDVRRRPKVARTIIEQLAEGRLASPVNATCPDQLGKTAHHCRSPQTSAKSARL